MDYDESIWVMIEFISRHPIAVPLTKIPDPPLPLRLLHTEFEKVRIENNVLETMISGEWIFTVHKKIFLDMIGMPENPKGFKVQEPSPQEFQSLLNDIGYAGEFIAK